MKADPALCKYFRDWEEFEVATTKDALYNRVDKMFGKLVGSERKV